MPGAGKQAQDVQDQIRELLQAGVDPTTIHRRLNVGRSSVYRMRRSIAQHGTAYAPVELNKRNGRPKTLTKEQELIVCDWLRDPKNREGYLDNMVWYIYNTFKVVVSTTTCSKMKRKWLQVIDAQERGEEPPDPDTIQVVVHRGPNKTPRKRKARTPSVEPAEQHESMSYPPPQLDPHHHIQPPLPTQPPVRQPPWAPMTQQMLQQASMHMGEGHVLPRQSASGATNIGN